MLARWLGLFLASTQLKESLGQSRDVPVLPALGVRFADEDLQKGVIAGKMYIRSPTDFSGSPEISHFSVYWGSDASTKLDGQAFATVDVSAIAPTCSGSSCSVITISPSSTSSSAFIISRGEAGYENDEYASILLPSDGTVTLTYLSTEYDFDILSIAGSSFSGDGHEGTVVDVTAGTTISWESDMSVTSDGWSLIYQSQVADDMQEVNIGTLSIPQSASHFLVYSGNSGGEMTSPLSVPIRDMYDLPVPSSLSFTDESSAVHFISGLLELATPSDVTDILRYDVYWGNSNGRSGVCSATIGYRFEPGPSLTEDCTGRWADLSADSVIPVTLQPIAAEAVQGPRLGFGLRFDGSFAVRTVSNFMLCDHDDSCYDGFYGGYDGGYGGGYDGGYGGGYDGGYSGGYSGGYGYDWTYGTYGLSSSNSDHSRSYRSSRSRNTPSPADWTIAAWIKPSVQPTGDGATILAKGYSEDHDVEFKMILSSNFILSCGFVEYYGSLFCEAPSALTRNTWTHAVCTKQSTEWSTELRIFVDGTLASTCNLQHDSYMSITRTWSPLVIGGGLNPESHTFFDGVLDDIAIFDYSLTASDVDFLYNDYRVASWPAGDTTNMQLETATPAFMSTLVAISVGEFVESEPLVIPLVDVATVVNLPLAVSFTDIDPAAGSYAGVVAITRASDESDISRYVAYWGSSSTTKLANAEIGHVDVAGLSGSEVNISLSASTPPEGASHIVVMSSINIPPANGESSQGVGVLLSDFAPPSVMAGAVSFSDTNALVGTVSGEIVVTRANNENDVVSYNLYFADASGKPLELIEKLLATSATLSHTLSNIVIPATATSILVLLEGSQGEAASGVSSATLDALDTPGSITFQDIDPVGGTLQGTITIQRAVSEENVQSYEVYWAQGTTQLQLLESIPLSSLSVTLVMEMYDSWGDGWNDAHYYIYGSDGAELASGTIDDGSEASDTLTGIPGSETLTITVTEGNYPGEISWTLKTEDGETILSSSDGSPFPTQQPFSLSGGPGTGGGSGTFQVTLVAGTSAPSGADHLVAFCIFASGETSMVVNTPLMDFEPPAGFPTSLQFADTDGGVGIIAGPITIGRATDETEVDEYKIYFGTGPSTKLSAAIASVSSATDPLVIDLASTTIPSSASHLLATASSSGGDNPQMAFVEIIDLQRPTSPPSNVVFTDMDPEEGSYGGVVSFSRAQDETAITHYSCFWGDSSSAPDPRFDALGSTSVTSAPAIYINSSQAPSGMTHLVVVSSNGAYSMPTGNGALLVDYATVTVVPSRVVFVDTDASLGNIEGEVTIGAASDESEVVDYAVYWGVTSSLKLPGGAPGLNAEFFVLDSCPCASCFVDFSTLGDPYLTRIDTASQYSSSRPGGSSSTWPGLTGSELFAARWTGWVQVIVAEEYYLDWMFDDRGKLFIDGVEVTDYSVYLTAGFHTVELQYFQCFGASYASVWVSSGIATGWDYISLWEVARNGGQEQGPIVTGEKTGSDVLLTIPASTVIPPRATHLLAFARASGGVDSVYSVGTVLVDFVKPSVTAGSLQFDDTDPSFNMIQGILTIGRAQNEANLNFYNVYWGSSATEIVSGDRRLQASSLGGEPSCTGTSCQEIQIESGENANEWIVTREGYWDDEQAFITLNGPAEIRFTELHTETCCDKLFFPDLSPISGYTIPDPFSLPEGVHTIEWYSDASITSNGWSFVYKYLGSTLDIPGLITAIPKPSGNQELAVWIEHQAISGTHFIVKTAYDFNESDTSVAIEIVDLSPPVLSVGEVTFLDTNTAPGIISGSVTVAAGSSEIEGFNIYWGRDSSDTIEMGNPGLLGEYFYLSSSPSSMPTFPSSPDVVQIDSSLNQPETTEPWPGLTTSENFGARWSGYIKITAAGTYFFTLSSDDGSQLYVNNALVVDNDGVHDLQSVTSQGVNLLPGLRSLEVLFFNGLGYSGIILEYSGPDTSNLRVVVPSRVLRHGSLSNALIGSVAAASGAAVFQIEDLTIPSEASHILVRGYSAEGEGVNGSSVEIRDVFPPTETASAVYFTDVDPAPGQIAGTIILEGAANQSTISHYVVYWGSSATSKLTSSPIAEISAAAGSSSSGLSCGVKGSDSTPLRFSRAGFNGPKIVNGQPATECEWRWQASLRQTSGFSFCGGTLISPRWVMSAAHCVDGASSFVVVLGDFNKDSPDDGHARTYQVQNVIMHEDYDSYTMENDFALIELTEEVEMNECVAPVCIPAADIAPHQECFITGWGTLSSGGSTPSELQEGMVVTLSNEECNARYSGQITEDMLCAQGSSSSGIVDACQGDSGGPLVCARSDGRYVLHGATSWGYGCADAQHPGIWARISHVLPWLTQHTGIEPGVESGNLTYNISSQAIPASATHLLVYTAMNGQEMTTGISIPLVDFAPLQVEPSSISFTDTDASPGELGGTITLGRASDESEVVGYAVYWGTRSVVMNLVMQVPKGSGGDVELQLPANTVIPSSATHLLGYVTSSSGRGASYVSVAITDLDLVSAPGGLSFQDTDPAQGQLGGIATIQQAADGSGILAYNLYFSSGNCAVLSPIASLPSSSAGGLPHCIEGNACSSITISQETRGVFSISRGMSGYENDEHAIIHVQGPGIVEFTRFDTESGYDILRVDQASFSGSNLPAIQMLGPGTKEIEWFSDFSQTHQGWALTFTSESSFGDITYNMPRTAIPVQATSLMVAVETSTGVNTATCASTTFVDFAPPSVTAGGLWFEDVNPSAGRVTGTLTILQARSHSDVTEYRIYWGMNSTTPMADGMVVAVTATTAGTNLTVDIDETPQGSYLLAFAASNEGQALTSASTEVVDYAPAQESAQGVNFTDVDPRAGFVSGTASVSRALDESTIDSYNLYFSNRQTRISFIGSTQANSASTRPSCSGQSCSHIAITEVAGKYQVSRGTSSYANNEYASIAVLGPATVLFTYFNTEENYDFVTVLGEAYSGSQPPPEIYIPSGIHEITWRSDDSVTRAGWEFMYESLQSSTLGIAVPQVAIPDGASHLLVVSNSSGGEMNLGVTTPLVDYNPPSAVPESVQCQDNDNSIGFIQGACIITRASDETGTVTYEIFWGNATHPLSPSLGSLALADAGAETTVTVAFSRFAVHPSASHLLAFAVGPGGVAVAGASTLLVDNIGITLSQDSLDVLGTPNSTTNPTITVTSQNSDSVVLNIRLDIEDGAASTRGPEEGGLPFSNPSSSNIPSICLEGGSHVRKSRLIFKMKKGSGRRLQAHARKLESRHGAKVKSFERLGGLAVAEIKNASVRSYCRLFTELDHDPQVEFVEEDQRWYPIGKFGNSVQVQPEYPLFPRDGKTSMARQRKGHMHRAAPQCHLGGCEGGMTTHPNDDSYNDLWGLHQDSDFDIDAPEAWSIHRGLSGRVIVAVIDTGVDYNHEDLQNQMWRNPGEIPGDGIDNDGNGYVDDVYGYDFYENDGDPMDTNGHGTHCAGTIGGEAGNSMGVAGVIWKPQIMALRFLGPDGGDTAEAIRAIDYAVQMGAHLSSNSWGGGSYSQALVAAIQAAEEANQVFIVAAGNDGQDNEVSPMYPCNYNLPNMICVASADQYGDLSEFSNWGTNVVHIVAPGSRIVSTYLQNSYESLSGTSMATPHVAGVAALVLDRVPSLGPSVLKQVILDSAVRYAKFASKVSTGGLLNAHGALVMASPFAWINMHGDDISGGTITIPAQSSTTISLELGGSELSYGEYRARLSLSGTFNGVLYSQYIPILYTVHDFIDVPSFGASGLQFQDSDGRRGMISGALTVTRATPEQEATFSQYHIFWAGSSQAKLSNVPLAALDTGNILHDNFAIFDSSFWFGPNGRSDFSGSSQGANWSVSDGAAVFSNQYPHSHLTLARRFAPPFTIRAKVRKATGALAQMVVEIGGSSGTNLFGAGGIRAVFLGSQKVLITPDGQHEAVPCVLGTWFEVTIHVLQNSVSFSDNQGCDTIVKTLAVTDATKTIRIGADCTGDCASAGGSIWDYFEVSGGLYATFNVPDGTMIPAGATGFVAHGWNVLGLSSAGLYQAFSDHRVANRAAQPSEVQASSPSISSMTVSWTRGGLNDCTGYFMRYEVSAQSANSATWFEADGCQGLVSQTAETCVATGLTSDTPYQFRVRVLCSLEETQSLWSEISAAAITLPRPAVAPSQLRVHMPGSSTMLLSWESGLLNDCEFVESVVEGQKVGESTWFRPQGCDALTMLNAYHCTATDLAADTSYVFRVQTSCADPQSSSPWSVSSIPESTLATIQAWESNQRRLISIKIASDLEYDQVVSNADAFKASIASQTATSLGVDASTVKVEIMAGETTSSGRRLETIPALFAITVEATGQSETSDQVMASVATAVEAETGVASTLSLAGTSTLTPAIAPEKIIWSEVLSHGHLHLHWNPLPLGDCSFLAWQVLANVGSSATPLAGCTNLMNLSHTECQASGMQSGSTFTVAVLCANPAANSVLSEASDAWQPSADFTTTTTTTPPCDFIATLSSVGALEISQNFADELQLEVQRHVSACAAHPSVHLKTTWQYKSDGWITLAAAGLVDSSPLPSTLRLAGFALVPGSHQFRALLEDGDTQVDSVTYTVVVTDSLRFAITGALAVGEGCGIDLGVAVTSSSHPNATASFTWNCLEESDGACSSLSNFASGPYSGSRLVVDSTEASLGTYAFRVTVTKTYGATLPNVPSLSSQEEVTVLVQEGGPLPVELTSPWTSLQRLSKATSFGSDISARIGSSNADCQVPDSSVFAWVVATEAEQRIITTVDTQVSYSSPGVAIVTTSEFPSGLVPSTSYIYAILRAGSSETLAAATASESLEDVAALDVSVSRSVPFVVDAAPSPGQIQIQPLKGAAVKTSFTFSTNGWSDEDAASLQYAFYIFPVGDAYTVSEGEDGQLQSTPAFQPPEINFEDVSSAMFWGEMDGSMLRSFAASPTVSQSLAGKAYFTVVRARDQHGAVASTTMLGPLVEMTSVSQEDLSNLLAASQQSEDPNQILTSVQTVMSVSGTAGASVATAALDALAGVTDMVEGDGETLQQLGASVTAVVSTGNLDTESLKQAADILDSCLDLALTSGSLSAAVGSSILGGIASIGQSSTSEVADEAKSVSTKLVSLVSSLGSAALNSLEDGETKEINSVDENGEGIKVAVTKPSVAEAVSTGLQLPKVSIGAEAFGGRRLDGCESLSVQVTEWLKSNPFSYTQEVLGTNGMVAENADVMSVEINFCDRSDLRQPVSVQLPLPDIGDSDSFPTCARFDKAADSWVTSDVGDAQVETTVDVATGTVTCSSRFTVASFSVFLNAPAVTTSKGRDDDVEQNLSSPMHSKAQMALGYLLFVWIARL